MDDSRERLREISRRLVPLHRLLLDRERRAYEAGHGAIPPGNALNLVLHDERFAWLRTLSSVMAKIDDAVDADDPVTERDVQAVRRELYRLLKSGEGDTFQEKYRTALQESPDVVMAHAAVSALLQTESGPPVAAGGPAS
jgi:hypothetical protein